MRRLGLVLAVLTAGCGDGLNAPPDGPRSPDGAASGDAPSADASLTDAPVTDAPFADASWLADAAPFADASWDATPPDAATADAATADDASVIADAAILDARLPDAAVVDAPSADAPVPDAGPDASTFDAQTADASLPDAVHPDALVADASLDASPDATPVPVTLTIAATGNSGLVEYKVLGTGSDFTPCVLPCQITALTGTLVDVKEYTASRFTGWSGLACSLASGDWCRLALTADGTLTANFGYDPGEVATFLLPARARPVIAFRPDGGFLLGSNTGVDAYALDVSLLWSTTIAGPLNRIVLGFAASHTGDAFLYRENDGVTKVNSDGTIAWFHALADTFDSAGFFDMVDATADGGAVVAGRLGTITKLDAVGAVQWQVTGLPFTHAIAVGADRIRVAYDSSVEVESCEVYDFGLDGTSLPGDYLIPGYYDIAMELDAADAVIASAAGHGEIEVSREGGFATVEDSGSSGATTHGIAVDSTGASVAIRTYDDFSMNGDVVVRRDPSGTVLSSFTHTAQDSDVETVLEPTGIAAGPGGRVAIVGNLRGQHSGATFVQVFDFDPATLP